MLQPDEEDPEGRAHPSCTQDHAAAAEEQSEHDALGTAGPVVPEPSASPRAVQGNHPLPGGATHTHTRQRPCAPEPTAQVSRDLSVGRVPREGTRLSAAQRPCRQETPEVWAALGNAEMRLGSPREGHPSAILPPAAAPPTGARLGGRLAAPFSAKLKRETSRPGCSWEARTLQNSWTLLFPRNESFPASLQLT